VKILLALVLLAGCAGAQTKKPFCDRACWGSVVVYSGGSALDWGSSLGGRELNPIVRQSDGIFSPWRGAVLKAAPLGLSFVFQKQHSRAMFWFRVAGGVASALSGLRNLENRSHTRAVH